MRKEFFFLLNSAYKLYSKIINERLRTISETILLQKKIEICKGLLFIDGVFERIIQTGREYYHKTIDRIRQDKFWAIMEKREY